MKGTLRKMVVHDENPVKYWLQLDEDRFFVNDWIKQQVHITFLNEIHCIKCGRETSKSYRQGYCYPCFITAPETEECVLRPELCRAHENQARDMDFAAAHCLIPHYVYLANSGGIKVGVTRYHQIPVRWIDQGASQAVKLAKTENRYLAGVIEVMLKKRMADKTNWRSMLSNHNAPANALQEAWNHAVDLLADKYSRYIIPSFIPRDMHYPVSEYPLKINPVNLDKKPEITGTLVGIRGQYLMFSNGDVFNVRKHSGYWVNVDMA
jgi:hypothetical protein